MSQTYKLTERSTIPDSMLDRTVEALMYMKTLLYGKWHRALLVQYMEVSIDQRNAPLNVEYDEKFEWCKFDRFATWCANPQPTLLRCLLFAVRGSHPHILPLLSRGAAPCRGSTTCTTSSCLNSGSNAAPKRVSTMLPTSSTKTMMTPFLRHQAVPSAS